MSTPLATLAHILCRSNESAIFKNQVTMYQLLILFSGNKLNSTYGTATTDKLIESIKPFLSDQYYNIANDDYITLHNCVFSNIIEDEFPSNIFASSRSRTGMFNSHISPNLKSTINKRINMS